VCETFLFLGLLYRDEWKIIKSGRSGRDISWVLSYILSDKRENDSSNEEASFVQEITSSIVNKYYVSGHYPSSSFYLKHRPVYISKHNVSET
jgi:hypothetical protein